MDIVRKFHYSTHACAGGELAPVLLVEGRVHLEEVREDGVLELLHCGGLSVGAGDEAESEVLAHGLVDVLGHAVGTGELDVTFS